MDISRRDFIKSMAFSLLLSGKAFPYGSQISFSNATDTVHFTTIAPKRLDFLTAVEFFKTNDIPPSFYYPAKRNPDNNLGKKGSDIDAHQFRSSQFSDAGLITRAHEDTHILQSEAEILHEWNQERKLALYVFDNVIVSLQHPQMKLSTIVPYIPRVLKSAHIYSIYFNAQTFNYGNENEGLYPLNEWNAYINGSEVGLDSKVFDEDIISTIGNMKYFDQIVIATGMAIKDNEPSYWNSQNGHDLRNFISWQLKRSNKVFEQGKNYAYGKDALRFIPELKDFDSSQEGKNQLNFKEQYFT